MMGLILLLSACESPNPNIAHRSREKGDPHWSREKEKIGVTLDRYHHQVAVSHGQSVAKVGSEKNPHTTAPK